MCSYVHREFFTIFGQCINVLNYKTRYSVTSIAYNSVNDGAFEILTKSDSWTITPSKLLTFSRLLAKKKKRAETFVGAVGQKLKTYISREQNMFVWRHQRCKFQFTT